MKIHRNAKTTPQMRALIVHRVRTAHWRVAEAGMTVVHEDIAGQNRVKGSFAPLGGRHDIGNRRNVNGFTVGGDIIWSVASRVSAVMPVRLTKRSESASDLAPGPLDIHAGVGLRWNALRRIS